MINVTASASGGVNNWGVYNGSSSPRMNNVSASASGGRYSYGIWNTSSSPSMVNVTARAFGGEMNTHGVTNTGSSSLRLSNVTTSASGGTSNYGIFNSLGSDNTITTRHCTLEGSDGGIYVGGGIIRVMQSSILGGVTKDSGTLTCVNSDNGVATALLDTCQLSSL